MEQPVISIILPTYKDASFLRRAIESVISQQYKEWELLIIDDGLTKNAQTMISQYIALDKRIYVIKNGNNLGIQKSLHKAISVARGKFIARIDDDDEWIEPTKLDQQISFFESNEGYVLVGTNAIIANSNGESIGEYSLPKSDNEIRRRILLKNCFIHPSVLVRKDSIIAVGGYSKEENFKHIEDYELWLRLGIIGKFANIDSNMVKLTVHEDSITAKNRVVQTARMRNVIFLYKNKYPNFLLGYLLLSLRLVGFKIISLLPIPKSLLYFLQKLYKSF